MLFFLSAKKTKFILLNFGPLSSIFLHFSSSGAQHISPIGQVPEIFFSPARHSAVSLQIPPNSVQDLVVVVVVVVDREVVVVVDREVVVVVGHGTQHASSALQSGAG
jgi:hypothetical protein